TRASAPPAPRRRPVRPTLEWFEERVVPSATVQSLGDVTGSALGNQFPSFDRTVARSTNTGNYAVSLVADDPSHSGIYGQLVRADNTPLTGSMHVYSTTATSDGDPSIAMNSNGQFAVAWSHRYDGSAGHTDTDIFVQHFNANGTPTYQRIAAITDHNES